MLGQIGGKWILNKQLWSNAYREKKFRVPVPDEWWVKSTDEERVVGMLMLSIINKGVSYKSSGLISKLYRSCLTSLSTVSSFEHQ